MVEQDKAQSKIPTSPDSFRFSPQQVCPGAPWMGGPQTGGFASTPEPKSEPKPSSPDSMIRRTTLQKREG